MFPTPSPAILEYRTKFPQWVDYFFLPTTQNRNLQDLDFYVLTCSASHLHASTAQFTLHPASLSMPEEPHQPDPVTSIAESEAGYNVLNNEFSTSHPESDITFLARAMAHISSPSFVPPVPIEHPESILLFVTASSKDSPLIIRVATEDDRNEYGPLRLLVTYPIVRNIEDDDDFFNGSTELFIAGLVNWFNECAAGASGDSLGNAQAEEDMSSWIKAQGSREEEGEEEDPMIHGDQEPSDEWWSKDQEASESENLWIKRLLTARDRNREMTLNAMKTP
ncbi:hypothetical protein HOY80DRAFT_1037904 [Tuber brumale]|nr:hypothetical protein HOY80DRAFT_1037904 [Tuber brumale]